MESKISLYGYTPEQALAIVQAIRKMPSMRAELPRLIKEFRALKEFYKRQKEFLKIVGEVIADTRDAILAAAFVSDKARTAAPAQRRDPCADCCREGAACQDCPDYD